MRITRSRVNICLLTILICAVFMLPGFRTVNAAESGGEKLTAGVPSDRCPVFYINPDTGEMTGIGVDLLRSAAEEAGYDVTFVPIREKTLKEALDNPAYDVILPFGSVVSSASGKSSIVTENLIQSPFTLVTEGKRSLPPIGNLHVGMLRSLQAGAETVSRIYPDMKISLYETMPECVKALRAGEVDALLHNSYAWSYVLQKPSYQDLAVQPSAMFSMDFRAGTLDDPKGREIIARLNGGIASLSDTGRQAIILDHTSRRLYRYDFSDYLYQYGLVILLAVFLFIALVILLLQRIRSMQKEHEEELQKIMDHDPVTGLLNMNGFRKRVEEILRTHQDEPYFLSYNNIRDFKFINDSLGREAGDELLKFWAKVSLENLSEDDEAIGRIDADHFGVLRHITDEEKMLEDERNVLTPVQNFFIRQGRENRVQICSGIYVLTPKDFRSIDTDHMLDLARVAEKRVRLSRKSNHEFYNPEQWQKGKRIAEIINYLPAAVEAGDIQVWYQPQVDFEKKKIIGAEALCRWDHTKLGWLYPFDFISTLEEAGLIFDLDRFVWERVCQDLHRWNEQGGASVCFRKRIP